MSGRYIDADKLKEFISTHDYRLSDKWNSTGNGMFTVGIFEAINEQSAADVRENVNGEWINLNNGNMRCSNCKIVYRMSMYPRNFCPNCGADMRREMEE